MRVLLEQVDTIDLDGLLKRVTALSNKDKIADVDIQEDRSRVYRFGPVAVRWSYLSEKWILQDGVAIEGTYDTAKMAIERAREISGYEEETNNDIIHTEPVPMKFDGAIPMDVIQSFQPTPVSPSFGGGGAGGGGGGPVSLNLPPASGPSMNTLGDLPGGQGELPAPAGGDSPGATSLEA